MLDEEVTCKETDSSREVATFVRTPEREYDRRIKKAVDKHAKGSVENISAATRDEILELLLHIEGGGITFRSEEVANDVRLLLWGKVGSLNGSLKLKHAETGIRFGRHGGVPYKSEQPVFIHFDPRV